MMRKMLIILCATLLCASVSAQKTGPAHKMSQQDYLLKSKHQRTAGMLFTIGGAATMVAGIIVIGSESETSYFPAKEVGTGLIIGGAAATTVGIVFFGASKKNSAKATRVDVGINLKVEKVKVISHASWNNNLYPALSLQVGLK